MRKNVGLRIGDEKGKFNYQIYFISTKTFKKDFLIGEINYFKYF